MRTYFLRYERQCANAGIVAEFLDAHPRVKHVHYPGLAGHPQHALARRQMKDFGTIVAIEIDGDSHQAATFAESLELFSIAASVGSTESLVLPPQLLHSVGYTAEQRAQSLVGKGTLRLSIGVEDEEDLRADLSQALDKAFS
jgi:cystathionine beta-lyase/cystathionine gamma-synthase